MQEEKKVTEETIEQELSLNDDRRVKVLSPGALVAKRFFRNRLAVVGLTMLVVMFVFSFIGGLISPYGQDEQFYTYTHMDKEYVGVVKNNDLRYTINDGQEFSSILQAQLMLAIGKNAESFEYKDVTYEVEKEGEDLYLIGTSEHSMIGKFIDKILPEEKLPQTLTSYSPCFRKEKGAHGIEERGVYRIHQFEKQEMIVVCKPEESKMWFDKLWKNTVDLFRSLDIPVRTLECCSGDLADLKVKSIDVEAWSPRQKKYFEVGSCSNLGDAQARRLKIRVVGENGKYFAHTLNNTVVAPPRMLIAFLENNLNADGSVNIPKALQPYMGGKEKIEA